MSKVLKIDASARTAASVSRQLTQYIIDGMSDSTEVIERNLSETDLPLVTEEMIGAYYTPAADRSDEQNKLIAQSDALVKELKSVDTLVIGAPIYNFSVPAALKAYIDLICRVGETFKYTENGPVGLSGVKKAIIVVATGGVPVGSPYDFNSGYLKQVMAFIGVDEVHIVNADGLNSEVDKTVAAAKEQIDTLLKDTAAA